jgi:hypothetical protein
MAGDCIRDNAGRCSRCLVAIKKGVRRNCSGKKPFMLGDFVAYILSAVGITPSRVEAAIGRPCGCKKRQQALNDAFLKASNRKEARSAENTT